MKSTLDQYFEDWRMGDVVSDFQIPMRIFPMEQGSFPKHKTREFKKVIRKIAQEEEWVKPIGKPTPVGLRVVFRGKKRGDQSNCLKLIEDALEFVAFENDCQILYHEVTTVPGPDAILVEIILVD